jgi:tetratricopeptide (TPR) repeat protein
MFGTPYEMAATIPAIIRKQLRHAFPDREFEVVNFGASAINTNVLVDLLPQLLDLKPDVLLVYTGHNEFYGPDGIGASWLEKNIGGLTSLKYKAQDIRIIRLLGRTLKEWQKPSGDGEQNLMKQVSRGAHVDVHSAETERIFQAFRSNLETLLDGTRRAGVPVIVSDIASNLAFPPFAYPAEQGFERLQGLIENGRLAEAEQRVQSEYAHDTSNAFITYWRGRIAFAKGDIQAGARLLRLAKDQDLLKFRAPERINEIIREVCREKSVTVVHADSLFASLTCGGINGDSLFWGHLHPVARGYYGIASLFVRALAGEPEFHLEVSPETVPQLLPFQADSLAIPWLDEAYADLVVRGLTSRWPFDHYAAKSFVLQNADKSLVDIAVHVYMKKAGWTEGCYRTAEAFERTGDLRKAKTTYAAVLDDNPEEYYAAYKLGILEKVDGNIPGALHRFRQSIIINPGYEYPRLELALLRINGGEFDEAISQLLKADSLAAGRSNTSIRATIHYGLSAAYANKQDFRRAMRYIEQSLTEKPSYEEAIALRGQIEKMSR